MARRREQMAVWWRMFRRGGKLRRAARMGELHRGGSFWRQQR